MSTFSVPGSAAGWLHQVVTGLTLLLENMRDPSCELFVEHLDDLEVRAGDRRELFQVKHHLAGSSLTDRASDLWRTLRVWCDLTAQGDIDPGGSILTLMTTQRCAQDTACDLLRDAPTREPLRACQLLEHVAGETGNAANSAGYGAFLALDGGRRQRLISAIRICDASRNLWGYQIDLERLLLPSAHYEGTVKAAAERLVGWWLRRVADALREPSSGVAAHELIEQIHEIFQDLTPRTLPISGDIVNLISEWSEADENRRLVRQLMLVEAQQDVIVRALGDYFRAIEQLSEWTRLLLVSPAEAESYRRTLVDEWDNERTLHRAETTRIDPHQIGFELYARIMRLQFPIRIDRREPWIMRGTFHELSDKLDVGWHPDYRSLLADEGT